MKVLSLDIDGVLNRHSRHENGYCGIEPECVKWLNLILAEFPGLRLVIHSAWRYMVIGGRMDLKGFEYLLLTHGVNCEGRIIGHTDADTVRHRGPETHRADIAERTAQIAAWWGKNSGKGDVLVAVDDLPLNLKNFVRTDGTVGLTNGDAIRIVQLLQQGLHHEP